MLSDETEFIAAWFALWRRSCVPVPLDSTVPAPQLTSAINESDAGWVICDVSSQALQSTNQKWKLIRSALDSSILLLQIDTSRAFFHGGTPALLFYTSGTTGAAKCVAFSQSAIAANVFDQIQAYELTDEDICATPAIATTPAALTTIVWPALASGARVTLVPRNSPGQILQSQQKSQPTVFYGVPHIFRILAEAMKHRNHSSWDSVRLCLSSSAYLDSKVFNSFQNQTELPIRSLYCSSEGGSATYNSSSELAIIRDSVGTPLPGVQLKIVDSLEGICLAGQEGEILLGGTHIAAGYIGHPELESRVFRSGWVTTGDLGYIDAKGSLYLTGRLSETINIGGHLVNPRTVEQVLLQHPSISEALVYARASSRFGEVVAAKVILNPGEASPPIGEVTRHCAEHLEHYKVVRHVEYVQELPRSRYGKVKRFQGTQDQ